jgi:hypothetical protein
MKAPLPKALIEAAVHVAIRKAVNTFAHEEGEALLRRVIRKALSAESGNARHRRDLNRRLTEVECRIGELIDSLTPLNKEFVDRKLMALKTEGEQIRDRLAELDVYRKRLDQVDGLVAQVLAMVREFDAVFAEGSLEEQKELVSLMVEKVDVDPVGLTARAYIRRFPAPSGLDAGKLSFKLVAGVRDEQQKIVFPPVDIVEIPLVLHGRVLVPAAA